MTSHKELSIKLFKNDCQSINFLKIWEYVYKKSSFTPKSQSRYEVQCGNDQQKVS